MSTFLLGIVQLSASFPGGPDTDIRAHRWTMISIFTGARVSAGLFTFVPGRIMHTVLFG
jgi:uncharacterized membrane protein